MVKEGLTGSGQRRGKQGQDAEKAGFSGYGKHMEVIWKPYIRFWVGEAGMKGEQADGEGRRGRALKAVSGPIPMVLSDGACSLPIMFSARRRTA